MTVDMSFHRAFDNQGFLRQGFHFKEETQEIVSSCSDQEALNYLFEDVLLSDQQIHDKVGRIQRNWSSVSFPECLSRLHLKLQQIDPLNRKALAIFLKQFPNLTASDAEKETNYFILMLEQLRSLHPEIAGKLEPFLRSDPHKIPLFLKLLDSQQTELCDYLITATKDADRIGSRKLIQAIVNRKDDPHFNEIVKGVKELLPNPNVEMRWLAKLIKHDLFLEIQRKSPDFLYKVVSQSKEHIRKGMPILRHHRVNPGFIECHFITMLQRDFPWCQYLDGSRHQLRIAEFLLNVPSELFEEVSSLCGTSSYWTSLCMIYEKDIHKILEIQRSSRDAKIVELAPHIQEAGLDRLPFDEWNRFAGTEEANWPFVEADYWLKKELKGDYERYQGWLSSFAKGNGYNKFLTLIARHLWHHPEQLAFYLDLKPKDSALIVRLMSANVDPGSLKDDWQRKLLLRIAKGDDFTPKKMNRFIYILKNQSQDVCSTLAVLPDNSPGLFNALLKVGANSGLCSSDNFKWVVKFAEKNDHLTAELQRLFGYRLQVNETSRMPSVNQMIEAMRRYPGNLRQALTIFSRNPQAFYEHISQTARWNTRVLTHCYEDLFISSPTETKRLIDGVCRLAAMNEYDILCTVTNLIQAKNYRQAQQITDLVFIGKKEFALELIKLPVSSDPYIRKILTFVDGFSAEIEEYLALHNHPLFRDLVLTDRIGFNKSFAKAFRNLNPEDQEAAALILQKTDLNPSEMILKTLLLMGNGILFRMLKHSETVTTEDFLHLDFQDPETQKYVEQVLIFIELISDRDLSSFSPYIHFCMFVPKEIPIKHAGHVLSKLTCLVSMRQIVQKDLYRKSYGECVTIINELFSKFLKEFFKPLRKLCEGVKESSLSNQVETALTDRLAELLVLKGNRLNLGLCEVFTLPQEGFPPNEETPIFHFDPYFKTMLIRLASDRELQSIVASISSRKPDQSDFKEFVSDCTGINKRLTDSDLQKVVVAAMLSRLKQGKIGSCFSTNLAIQIQNSYPLLKAQDLKNIVENEVLTRPSGNSSIDYPLILPTYIFSRKPRLENGLLQVWDFSLANMAGQEERMFKRIANPVRRLVVKALNKVNAPNVNELSDQIIGRLRRELRYVYNPDEVSKKGIFILHKSGVPIVNVLEFLTAAKEVVQQLAHEESGAAAHLLEYLCHEVFTNANVNKFNELLTVESTQGTGSTRLEEKRFIKAITNFPGGYGASVLRNYFGIKNLYEETFTAHSAKETLENLLDLQSGLPRDAIVSYFTMGHVSSLLKDVPTLSDANVGEITRLGDGLRKQPVAPFLQEMNGVLANSVNPEEMIHIDLLLKETIDLSQATIEEYFNVLPHVLEVVTGKVNHEFVYASMDNCFMKKGVLRAMLPIVHVIYTNWFQTIRFEDKKVGTTDIHFGFGYRLSKGGIGIFKVSDDETIVAALSLRETMKTQKIRFIIK